ncbi:hypothetical protein RUM43_010155 [Polyplax serrata]|uniref:CRAL-TRIO domain-containing protein n=1 Tax=Polyplax serrata TaxID=468196 RepID=A0AAN8P740_POLSC
MGSSLDRLQTDRGDGKRKSDGRRQKSPRSGAGQWIDPGSVAIFNNRFHSIYYPGRTLQRRHPMAPTMLKHPFIDGNVKVPSDKLEAVEKIKSWMKSRPELPSISDEFVYMFLHSNYSDVENTKKTIEVYFAVRCSASDLFLNQSPFNPDIQSGLSSVYMASLPKTTPEGYKVLLTKLTDRDPNKFVHLHAAKAMLLFNDVRISEDGIVPGYVVVNDARGYTWTHLSKMSLHILKVYMKYVQEAKPIRIKALHVIYSAKIIDKVMTVAKPFMKTELQKLIKIHTGDDLSEFFKSVPQEIMPRDYGGQEEKSLAELHDENKLLMESKYPKWVEEEEDFLKNAAKLRSGKSNGLGHGIKADETVPTLRNLSID